MKTLHDLRDLGAPDWYLNYLYNEVPLYTIGVSVRAAAPLVLALGHAQAVNKRLANQCLKLDRERESRNKSLANARKEKREQEASNSSRNRYIAQLQQTITTLQADNLKLQEAYNQRKVMDFGLVYGVGGNVDLVEKALDKQELQRKLGTAERKVTELQSALDSAKEEAGKWADRHDEQLALHLEAKDQVAQDKKAHEARLFAIRKEMDLRWAEDQRVKQELDDTRKQLDEAHALMDHRKCMQSVSTLNAKLDAAERQVAELQALQESVPELRQLVDKQAKKIDELCRRPERVLLHHPDPCISKPPEPEKRIMLHNCRLADLRPGDRVHTLLGRVLTVAIWELQHPQVRVVFRVAGRTECEEYTQYANDPILYKGHAPLVESKTSDKDKEVRCAGRIIQSLYPGAVLQTTAGFCHAVKEVWSIGMQTYALTEACIDKKQTRTVWQQEGQDLVPCKDPVALPEEYADIRFKSTWALGDKVRLDEHLFGEVTCLEREGEELVTVQITVYHKDSKRFYWLVRRRLGGQLALTDRYAEKKAT